MECGEIVIPGGRPEPRRMAALFDPYETYARELAANPLQMQPARNGLCNARLLWLGTAMRFAYGQDRPADL